MEISMKYVVLVYIFAAFFSSSRSYAYASQSVCGRRLNSFLHDLKFQCPLAISFPFSSSSSSPVEMDGESLDRSLSSTQKDVYTAVLFYASWCPFSRALKIKFSALSSVFPEIRHVMVEQSAVMPSVFSRYGIHSLPSLLMMNGTDRVRYHGDKDIRSLVNFYKKTTGLESIVDLMEDKTRHTGNDLGDFPLWSEITWKDMFKREPYLVLSVVFVLLRAFVFFFPGMVSCAIALWVVYAPHLNLGIFGESRQLLGRALHLFDVKRVWSKLKLCKTRNFHKSARNARVWASLASVSLGETSSPRVSPSADL